MSFFKNKKTIFITQAAVIAALYVLLSLPMMSFSFGVIQFRLSEVLTILPYFTPAAIPGLFIGCVLTNLLGSSFMDMIVGSLATLLAAYLSYRLRKHKWLVPAPPVIINALAIGTMLYMIGISSFSWGLSILYIGLSQIVVCYVLGMPLLLLLDRSKTFKRVFVYNKTE